MKFENKIVVVTGGTGALGKSILQAFLNDGATIVSTFIIVEELDALSKYIDLTSEKCICLKTDLFNEGDRTNLKNYVLDKYGSIDILVNLAGGFSGGNPVMETPDEDLDRMINLNFKTAFYMCKAFLPEMMNNDYGKIINIGARAGTIASPNIAAYAASKAALINLTKSIAAEVKNHNINVNVILPSTIDTPANRLAMPEADFNNWVKPEAISKLILFLASDDSKDISGTVIPIYGKA